MERIVRLGNLETVKKSYKILSGIKMMIEIALNDYDLMINPIKEALKNHKDVSEYLEPNLSVLAKEKILNEEVCTFQPVYSSLILGIKNLI